LWDWPATLSKSCSLFFKENAAWAWWTVELQAVYAPWPPILDLSCLIGTTCVRHQIPGWKHDLLSLRHCEVSGITTTLTQGCCLIRDMAPPLCEPIQRHCKSGCQHSFESHGSGPEVSALPCNSSGDTFGV
jgi:hypothetical protein